MRDPAVQALYALHLRAEELAAVLGGQTLRRPVWPPQRCQGAVVGLCAGGLVVGEARLDVASHADGGACWSFGPVVGYARPLPHVHGRGMSSPMPAAPLGTLTSADGVAARFEF